MEGITLTCPSCKKKIRTKAESDTALPISITCPGCSYTTGKVEFLAIPNFKLETHTQIPPDVSYSADAAPVTIPEAPAPVKPPRQPSTIDALFEIGHTRTKSYAQVLWVTSLIASIIADCLLVMYAVGKSPITGIVGIVSVHLIVLPMIRIALECAVNVERIAKK